MTNLVELHQSLYLSDLPTSIYKTTLAFLTPQEQGISNLISKVWYEALKSRIRQFSLMQSITGLPLRELEILMDYPNLIERLAHQKLNQNLDPTNKFIGRFLSKVIEYKASYDPEEMISFLSSLSEKKREAISRLCFNKCIVLDSHITQVFHLCPNLKYLDLKETHITREGLSCTPEKNN
ncbi:MAG: hypothetical protein COT84_00675 [Chlamydiae bacterium CG10_big_fil_rev_8_21_14_0_10_35_9]|nr:MAG: hypothetical protein COT84_00675 [Chlamydiae bacterium CG10_big_fil_rev_8_21_14_0_10_35_9]